MTTPTNAAPVVATYGNPDPTAPLVVLLHGRGAGETEILGLAAHLPRGPEYAAVRAPIAEGGGYACSPTAASAARSLSRCGSTTRCPWQCPTRPPTR